MCIYVYVHCMYTHIYKLWVLALFWEGEAGHPQVSGKCVGLEIVPHYCVTPVQATGMAFLLL